MTTTQISYLISDKRKKKIESIYVKTKHASLSNMKISRIKLDTCGISLTLKILDVSFNKIDSIPEIMTLEELYCNNCNIKSLPIYLPRLTILHCANNKIETLDFPRLITARCEHNQIRFLKHEQVPNLLQLSIDFNPLLELTCRFLVFLSASHCPIMVAHKIKSLTRSIGDKLLTKEIMDSRCPLFIDWRTQKCKNEFLFKSIFPNKTSSDLIYDYLFMK